MNYVTFLSVRISGNKYHKIYAALQFSRYFLSTHEIYFTHLKLCFTIIPHSVKELTSVA